MSTLPPELRTELLARVKDMPAPTAGSKRREGIVAVLLGVATAVVMLVTIGVGLGGRPLAFVALSGVGWALIAAMATGLGTRGRSMTGRTTALLVVVAFALAPCVFVWVMGCTVGWPEVREPEGTWRQHLGCLFTTMLLALGPVLALTLVRRGLDPVHPRATGAVSFAAAGAWAGALIDMHCPLVSPLHVAFAHVMPIVLCAFAGALFGARLFGLSVRQTERAKDARK